MNRLSTEKRAQILGLFIDGNSLKATSKFADISINTVMKLLREVGEACANFHDKNVRNLKAEHVAIEAILTFVSREKGVERVDLWTETAFDTQTKLIVSWFLGACNEKTKQMFSQEVSERFVRPVQFSFNSNPALPEKNNLLPIDQSKSSAMNIWFMPPSELATCPDKKITNYLCAVAIHTVHYNFVKTLATLRATPAMQAGLVKKPMTLEEMVELNIASGKVPKIE